MNVTLLHSAPSAIWVVVSGWLSIISRIRCSFEGASIGAILQAQCWESVKSHLQKKLVSCNKLWELLEFLLPTLWE